MDNNKYNYFLDTHCHYYDLERDYIQKTLEKYNIIAISASVDIESYNKSEKLKNIKNLYFAYGLYPEEALKKKQSVLQNEIKQINFENAIAVGEIGLDYKITKDQQKRIEQKELFIKQIEIAEKYDLPIIVHTRYATKPTLDILKDYSKLKVILHWFSGSENEIKEALKRGYFLTQRYGFPKLENIDNKIKQLFIETDFPVPKNNTNPNITDIIDSYKIFCETYNLNLDFVKKEIIKNFENVFNNID